MRERYVSDDKSDEQRAEELTDPGTISNRSFSGSILTCAAFLHGLPHDALAGVLANHAQRP